MEPRDLVTLVAAYARLNGLSAAWRLGEEWAFWRRVWEFAGALVVRQSYLPTVMETRENPSRWLPFWQPVYEAEDLRRHEQLAEAMPVVARAVRWEPKRKPPDEPQFLVRDIVARLVECLVWVGYMTDEVSRGPSTRWHRWG
ncbi:MAG: hypothetical protein NTY38_12305 [Acidobacteria bacterium]|nr:hypothetical protein [Acidobacteriota bacterium]